MNGHAQRFVIYRKGEVSNIATCRHVGEGIVFSSNKVVVNWLTGQWPVSVYNNLNDARQDICRDGRTEIVPAEQPC